MGCPLIRVPGNAFAVIMGGQKEEGVLCCMVASVTLRGRDAGESFLPSFQKVTDVPLGVLQVLEMRA